MALEDAGLVGALPYMVVVALSVLVLINPLIDPGNGPLSEWAIFSALGIVPAALLWFARPRSQA